MGDNRNNSLDARAWGFVPFDHVVGKPVFIWMSIGNFNNGIKNWKVRWDRVFTTVSGNGKANSFLLPFLAFLIAYIIFSKWWKKNKTSEINENLVSDSNIVFASIQDRVKAAVIDSFIIMLSLYLASELFSLFDIVSNSLKIIVTIFIFLLYDPLLVSLKGGTIGHIILKITVKKEDNISENISFFPAIFRFILKALLGWFSLISISGNEKKKAIHDYAVNSIVLKKK